MRTCLFVSVALLLCACVAREQPRSHAQEPRFEIWWGTARPWGEAISEWAGYVDQPAALPHTTALFWPEHEGKPGLELGRLVGIANLGQWREREVIGATFRAEFAVDANLTRFGGLELTESSYAWEIPVGARLEGDELLRLDGAWFRLVGTPPIAWTRARVVFRLRSEPTPTSLYHHGTEILVASWGAALEPLAIELTTHDGDLAYLFINESGPG
ncbi:MAG: hypothetical protein K8I27_10595 [Planctomycetes bacterium]|nr:hypothetical protein [Planctomycetota bacterium]